PTATTERSPPGHDRISMTVIVLERAAVPRSGRRRLLTGKLQGHGFPIFEATWLVKRQEQFARWANRECFKDHSAPAAVNIDFTRALGENVTKRIISHVRH